MDYFQKWVDNTILKLGGIAPQYPCGLQRKLVPTYTETRMDACQGVQRIISNVYFVDFMRVGRLGTTNLQK